MVNSFAQVVIMDLQIQGAAKRLLLSLLAAAGLSGCAVYGYGPPYSTDDSYYDTFSPGYSGPPVMVDLGFVYGRSDRHRGRHYRGHDFRAHRDGYRQPGYHGHDRR